MRKNLKKQLKGADGIRAIACLMVVFTHLSVRLSMNSQSDAITEVQYLFKTFPAGVSAFFVLSGFLLSYPFWTAYFENNRIPSLRLFALRRAARIIPGFYLSLTFCFLMSLVLVPGAGNAVWRYIAGLTFTSAFTWQTLFPTELNGPLWSIGFEVLCYFLMPIFMIGLFSIKSKHNLTNGLIYWTAALSFVLIVNQLIFISCQTDPFRKSWDFGLIGGAKTWWPHYNPIGFFGQYIFGVFSAAITINIGKALKSKTSSIIFDIIAIIVTLLLIAFLWYMRHRSPFSWSFQEQPYYFPLFPIGISLLLCVLPFSRFLGNIFDNRFFKVTALLSFGIYIWHNVILEMIKYFWMPMYRHGEMTDLGLWFSVSLVALILSYAIASLSWFFVEKPAIAWSHKQAEVIKVKFLKNRYCDKSHIPISLQIRPDRPSTNT